MHGVFDSGVNGPGTDHEILAVVPDIICQAIGGGLGLGLVVVRGYNNGKIGLGNIRKTEAGQIAHVQDAALVFNIAGQVFDRQHRFGVGKLALDTRQERNVDDGGSRFDPAAYDSGH